MFASISTILHSAGSRRTPATLVASDTGVRILVGALEIACHARTYDRHQFVLDPEPDASRSTNRSSDSDTAAVNAAPNRAFPPGAEAQADPLRRPAVRNEPRGKPNVPRSSPRAR